MFSRLAIEADNKEDFDLYYDTLNTYYRACIGGTKHDDILDGIEHIDTELYKARERWKNT